MIIDSLSDTEVYVEQKVELLITANSTVNNHGVIEQDDKKNSLISIVDSGDTNYYRLEYYNGADSLMLYNEVTKEIQLTQSGDFINVRNDFINGTKYFVGAVRIFSTSVNGKVFQVPLGNKKVFKVHLQGFDIPNYVVNGDTITINGLGADMVDRFSKIVVYAYDTTELTGDTQFLIKYLNYDIVWSDGMLEDPEFFTYFRGDKLETFTELTVNSDVTEDELRKEFSLKTKRLLNGVKNTISMTTFDGLELYSLADTLVGTEFRMLLYNGYYGRVVIINNCRISDNMNLIYNQQKNTKTFTIYCGNYIDIKLGYDSYYGVKAYGRGRYGGGKSIRNSARISDEQ